LEIVTKLGNDKAVEVWRWEETRLRPLLALSSRLRPVLVSAKWDEAKGRIEATQNAVG
jgi:hypothetical protein